MSKEQLRSVLVDLLVDIEDASSGKGTITNREISDRLRVLLSKLSD